MKLYGLFRLKKYGEPLSIKDYTKEEAPLGSPVKRDPLLGDLEDIDEFDKDVHDKFNKHMA